MSSGVREPVDVDGRGGATAAAVRPARVRRLGSWQAVLAGLAVVAVVVAVATTPPLRTGENLLVILRSAALTGIVAVGVTFVTVSGLYFPLSSAGTAVLSGITFALLADGRGAFVALVAALAVGVVVGIAQGWAVGAGGNPIVTTLACGIILLGLAVAVSANSNVYLRTDVASFLGTGRPLGVPVQVYWFFLAGVLGTVVLRYTRFGRQVVLLGANPRTAHEIGINRTAIAVAVFTIAAVAAAFVGICTVAQTREAGPVGFGNLDVDVIAAVVVGGTAVAGGRGSAVRSMLGTLVIALLQNLMVVRGFAPGTRVLLVGLGVLVVVVVSTARGRVNP